MERIISAEIFRNEQITFLGSPLFSVPTGWNRMVLSICTTFSFSAESSSVHSRYPHQTRLTRTYRPVKLQLVHRLKYPFCLTWKIREFQNWKSEKWKVSQDSDCDSDSDRCTTKLHGHQQYLSPPCTII